MGPSPGGTPEGVFNQAFRVNYASNVMGVGSASPVLAVHLQHLSNRCTRPAVANGRAERAPHRSARDQLYAATQAPQCLRLSGALWPGAVFEWLCRC